MLNVFHLLPNNKKRLTILEDVSGVLKPSRYAALINRISPLWYLEGTYVLNRLLYFSWDVGRMTLLLGPPSSGKTTLMLALAGKLDPTLKVSLLPICSSNNLYT